MEVQPFEYSWDPLYTKITHIKKEKKVTGFRKSCYTQFGDDGEIILHKSINVAIKFMGSTQLIYERSLAVGAKINGYNYWTGTIRDCVCLSGDIVVEKYRKRGV